MKYSDPQLKEWMLSARSADVCDILRCEACGKSLHRTKADIQRLGRRSQNITCSAKCASSLWIRTQNTKEVPCGFCAKIVRKRHRALVKSSSGNVFCSLSCSASFSNLRRPKRFPREGVTELPKDSRPTPKFQILCGVCNLTFEAAHKTQRCCSEACRSLARSKGGHKGGLKSASQRVLRSKDEIALFELCKSHYHFVDHNLILVDGWDADIVIPNLKVAILWNGPWHYRQLGLKNHSLSQVQNRDRIKTRTLESQGWKVIAFEDRFYSPQQAFEALLKLVPVAAFESAP